MDETNTTRAEYRPAPDFNPYHHANALLGITWALDALIHDDSVTECGLSNEYHTMASGLLWAQLKLMRELHEWLTSIEDITTIRLPKTARDFERHHVRHCRENGGVKDERAIYAVK